jgi:hypothetical protein
MALALLSLSQPAGAIVIKGYDDERADAGWGLTESNLTTTVGYITNPANFGPSGTVPVTYQVGSGVSVASAATLAGTDVFFTGWVDTNTYTPAEKTALHDFVVGGGTLIATTDDSFHTMVDAFGLSQGDGSGNPTVNQITNASHPIANGPFGTVSTYYQYALTGHYTALGSATEIGHNADGPTIAVIARGALGPGSGAAIFVADIDVFSNDGIGGAATNETLIKNIFAFAANAPPPPPSTAYARPLGATPYRISLVPVFNECTSADSTHAAPLSYPSCSPPQQASGRLTMGTPDANGKPAKFVGSVIFNVLVGNPSTPADESDNLINVDMTDVRRRTDLADYTGETRVETTLRMTDKLNGPSGTSGGTLTDLPFGFSVPCSATADTTIGSRRTLNTSLDTLVPGMVPEGKRTVTHPSDIVVYDGGPDDDGDTTADNTPFAWGGLFTP